MPQRSCLKLCGATGKKLGGTFDVHRGRKANAGVIIELRTGRWVFYCAAIGTQCCARMTFKYTG
jgi:hypothetical protein